MNLRERRQARRDILAKARQYAEAGKSIEELQADLLDEADEKDGDITVWISLITTLLPLLMQLFAAFRK